MGQFREIADDILDIVQRFRVIFFGSPVNRHTSMGLLIGSMVLSDNILRIFILYFFEKIFNAKLKISDIPPIYGLLIIIFSFVYSIVFNRLIPQTSSKMVNLRLLPSDALTADEILNFLKHEDELKYESIKLAGILKMHKHHNLTLYTEINQQIVKQIKKYSRAGRASIDTLSKFLNKNLRKYD